jgi:hypothetical protein
MGLIWHFVLLIRQAFLCFVQAEMKYLILPDFMMLLHLSGFMQL